MITVVAISATILLVTKLGEKPNRVRVKAKKDNK